MSFACVMRLSHLSALPMFSMSSKSLKATRKPMSSSSAWLRQSLASSSTPLSDKKKIVIKSMGDYLQNIPGIAGATIRGDGRVTLIVDVSSMMNLARQIKTDIKAQIESEAKKAKEKPSDYNVLIVDDSKMDRTLMQKALEPLGVSVFEATNGVEALDLLKTKDKDIDAMLIDIEMPKMDGYTLAGEIRKYSKYRNLPLIAVTSRTSKTDRLRGVEVGMTEYITKPYSPEYLENVVRKNLKLG